MSDDIQDVQSQPDAAAPQELQPQNVHAVLKNLRRETHSGVRFSKLSNLGPLTVHTTGSSDKSKP